MATTKTAPRRAEKTEHAHASHASGHPSGAVCPIAQASSLLCDMWVILIVRDLLDGPRRFTELQKSLVPSSSETCINTRTLTDRLKALEEEGVLKRTAYEHEMPPRVDYELTKKGRALSHIIHELKEYGKAYL